MPLRLLARDFVLHSVEDHASANWKSLLIKSFLTEVVDSLCIKVLGNRTTISSTSNPIICFEVPKGIKRWIATKTDIIMTKDRCKQLNGLPKCVHEVEPSLWLSGELCRNQLTPRAWTLLRYEEFASFHANTMSTIYFQLESFTSFQKTYSFSTNWKISSLHKFRTKAL